MHKKIYDNTGLLSVDKQQQLRQSKVDRKETRRQKKQTETDLVSDKTSFVFEVRIPRHLPVSSKRMRYCSIQNYYDVTAHRCVRTYLRRCAMWGSRVRCASARTAAVVGRAPSSWFGRECDQSSGSASRSAGTCRPSSEARALSICTAAAEAFTNSICQAKPFLPHF